MASSSSRFVIPTEPGDPTSVMFIDDSYVVSGTLMGKIWVYDVGNDTRCLYAGFSDDAVRGLFIQDKTLYATIGDQYCKFVPLNDPLDQLEVKFDRRSGSSGFRYVFQKFNQVTIIYPGMTTFVDVVSNDQNMCPFKIQQPNILNVIPVDSFHYYLLLSEFPASMTGEEIVRETRRIRIVDVSIGETIFTQPSPSITHASLIDKKHMLLINNSQFMTVYNFKDKIEVVKIRNLHKSADVVAIDAVFHLRLNHVCSADDLEAPSGPRRLSTSSSSSAASLNFSTVRTLVTTVSSDGLVLTWDYTSGAIHFSGQLTQFCFSVGFPYCVQTHWNDSDQKISAAVSHDYGVSIVTLASSSSSK